MSGSPLFCLSHLRQLWAESSVSLILSACSLQAGTPDQVVRSVPYDTDRPHLDSGGLSVERESRLQVAHVLLFLFTGNSPLSLCGFPEVGPQVWQERCYCVLVV